MLKFIKRNLLVSVPISLAGLLLYIWSQVISENPVEAWYIIGTVVFFLCALTD